MLKYAYNPKLGKSARVYGRGVRVSAKDSAVVCRRVTGMGLQKGKEFLLGLLAETRNLDGKHYTKSAKELLELLGSAESNAEFKGLDTSRLVIHASAHKGFRFWRPRRFKLRGQKRKTANLQVVLEER